MKAKTMTEGTPWKHILKFSLPVLAGSLLQQLYNTVDTIIVGRYASEDALSAVGTTGSFAFLFLALAMGFSAGNGVVVAQHYGAGNEKAVRNNASSGIFFLMILGEVSTFIAILTARPAYTYLLNVDKSILDLTLSYFRWYAVGLVFQFGYNIFSAILRAVGDSAATMYFLLISSVLNIGLDILFVAVFKWGVAGAAIATDIAQAASFIAAYFYMRIKYPIFRFKLNEYRWDSRLVLKTVSVGFPISLQLIIVSFGLTFIQRAVNDFGKTMTASFTVGQRIEMYLNLPCNAFQTALATYSGQNIGAGKMDRIKSGVRQTLIISLIMTLAISACVWLFAPQIITLFSLSEQAAEYCLAHLRAIALINIVLSMYIPLFGVFQGANHSGLPTVVATCALGMRVLVTYLFRYSHYFGHTIIWWNGIFGFGVGFLVTWICYMSGVWKKNSNISSERAYKIQEELFMKKTIFIVGAGKGLGTSLGKKFGANDFRVVLMERNADSLDSYAKEFQAEGIEVYTKTADAADDTQMSKALSEAVAEYGTPDVLAYNVGITSPDSALADGVTPAVLRERYQADVVGAYNCIKQIATDEFAKKNGAILVTGGGLAMYPSADYLPLSMDKAALRAMVQALHPVMQERGIFLGILTVCNVIMEGSTCAPDILAEKYWEQYTERKDWEVVCQ